MDISKLKSWGFGTDEILADKLKRLVLEGKKTATTGLYKDGGALPKVTDIAIITDYNDKPFCIIEYTAVNLKPFLDVTYDYVLKEGEGDKDLESWRKSHRNFFNREYPDLFNENSLVVCEEFKIKEILN